MIPSMGMILEQKLSGVPINICAQIASEGKKYLLNKKGQISVVG